MVVNLSYKLTHLAQSLRPQHHFTTLRSAFPSASSSSPGFDFTSNVFGAAQNAASSSGTSAGGATAIGLAAGAVGAGAGASAGAGSGGSSSKAGSWGSHWGFQTGKSITQAPAAQSDSTNSNSDEDNLRTALSSPHRRILRDRRGSISSSSPFAFRLRRNNSIVPTELLHAEEAGLSSVRVRLSSSEMQRRYHSAFSQGKRTEEVEEMQKEQQEVDLGPERVEAEIVRKTGRRASISEQPSSPAEARTPEEPSATTSPSSVASTPFTHEPPPPASTPRTRRNSTAPTFPVRLDKETFSAPQPTRVKEMRPPTSGEKDKGSKRRPTSGRSYELNPAQLDKANAIRGAEGTGKIENVEAAIRGYLADKSTWTTTTHNHALRALLNLRHPDSPLDTIVTLYNQLFEHESLRPNLASYELVLRAFCRRDEEVQSNIRFIHKRMKKKMLAGEARGAWNLQVATATQGGVAPAREAEESQFLLERERQRLTALQSEDFDYFTPALQIYRALGKLGDKLPASVVALLLQGAVARQEVELALELFARLEKSRYQSPTARTYQSLIEMYGSVEKDKEAVMDVFETFLAARADGSLVVPTSPARSARWYDRASIKHGFDSSPEYVLVDPEEQARRVLSVEDQVWTATVKALFSAGDASAAVALLERLLVAQNSPDPLPAGYPESLNQPLVAQVVDGFLSIGDEEGAKRWFDRLAHPEGSSASAPLPHPIFYSLCFYGAVDSPFTNLLNHIYRSVLERASPDFPISVSDFFTVIDKNLARAWQAADEEERNRVFDDIAEFRAKFEHATKQGYLTGVTSVNFGLSTGLLGRIVQTLGYYGRFEDAKTTFHEYANIVRSVMAKASASAPKSSQRGTAGRSQIDWVRQLSDVASGGIGLKPDVTKGRGVTVGYVSATARPSLRQAVTIVGWTSKLRNVIGWEPMLNQVPVVVDAYLRDRDQLLQHKDRLSGDHWYTVLESFAHVQALIKKGQEYDFEFPGFERAFEDFVASGAKLPEGFEDYDYAGFVRALKFGGASRDQIIGVIEYMNGNLIERVEPEQDPVQAVESATSPISHSAESAPATATSATGQSSIAEEDDAPSYTPAKTLPTPPSTPPAYFAELAPAPAPSFEFENLDRALTDRINALVRENKVSEALHLVHSTASAGQFAAPEAYGQLVEQLGRQHLVQDVRQVYLIAYAALQAMSSQPEAQSLAWVRLEDKMVIALAQAGELVDVGHHRDRLYEAGCAPSADGYAAMILNMKETTDDAAVALQLFEESQRYNVRPNVYLFNTLISKLSRARRAKEALEYFELMKTYGIRPTSITYGAIINACCKTGDDLAADYLFHEMITQPDFKPRVPPYNTMIQFYTSTKPNRKRALQYYGALVQAKVEPTGHTYKLLLDAYGSIGEPDLDRMQQVFAQLVRDRKVNVTGGHWASMITAYGAVAGDLDRAIAIFDSIAHHPSTRKNPNGPLPDAVVYEALLNALLANDKAELCDKYLEEMKNKGVRMTAYVANSLIKGYTAQNNFAAARAVFLAMQDAPVGVASLGNHPIDRHPKHHHQTGTSTSTQMSVDAPVYREPSTYEMMVKCELKAGETRAAAEIVQMAEQRAFPPAVIARLQRLLTDVGAVSLV